METCCRLCYLLYRINVFSSNFTFFHHALYEILTEVKHINVSEEILESSAKKAENSSLYSHVALQYNSTKLNNKHTYVFRALTNNKESSSCFSMK